MPFRVLCKINIVCLLALCERPVRKKDKEGFDVKVITDRHVVVVSNVFLFDLGCSEKRRCQLWRARIDTSVSYTLDPER